MRKIKTTRENTTGNTRYKHELDNPQLLRGWKPWHRPNDQANRTTKKNTPESDIRMAQIKENWEQNWKQTREAVEQY